MAGIVGANGKVKGNAPGVKFGALAHSGTVQKALMRVTLIPSVLSLQDSTYHMLCHTDDVA